MYDEEYINKNTKGLHRGFGDKMKDIEFTTEDYVNYVCLNRPCNKEKRKEDRGQYQEKNERNGIKDRGREGGNFSGENKRM